MSIDYLPGDVLRHCRKLGWKLAAAESCTGGMIASILTDEPGCSDVFDRGYVTYSNAAKTQMLGVKAALIKEHGAVSDEVARAMAEGALAKAKVDIAVAVTGIAGPDGGTDEKPVGLVHIACAYTGGETVSERHLWKLREPYAGRKRIRELSAREALEMMRVVLDQELTGTP